MKTNFLAIISVALLLTAPAYAGGALQATTVASVTVDYNGLGLVTFSQPLGGTPPGCVISGYASSLAVDTNTVGGRSLLAVVLSAKASGSTVDVGGRGACSIFPNQIEDLYFAVAH